MTLLILEMLLALAVIVGIMVWTLKTRTDTPVDALEEPQEKTRDALNEPRSDQESTGTSEAQSGRNVRVD